MPQDRYLEVGAGSDHESPVTAGESVTAHGGVTGFGAEAAEAVSAGLSIMI